jgi:hypothetical protein
VRANHTIANGTDLGGSTPQQSPPSDGRNQFRRAALSPSCSRIELETLGTSHGELRLLEAMGRETANIHLGTEEKRRAILKDLRGRKGNWLLASAEAMAETVEKDWKVWKERWQS